MKAEQRFTSERILAQTMGVPQRAVRLMGDRGDLPYIDTPLGRRYLLTPEKLVREAIRRAEVAKANYPGDLKNYKPGDYTHLLMPVK